MCFIFSLKQAPSEGEAAEWEQGLKKLSDKIQSINVYHVKAES